MTNICKSLKWNWTFEVSSLYACHISQADLFRNVVNFMNSDRAGLLSNEKTLEEFKALFMVFVYVFSFFKDF